MSDGVRRVPPVTALQKPEEQQAQALAMMTERILGKSIREIAEEFRVSKATVQDRLALARESGVLPQAKLLLLERLLPKALAVYDAALDQQPVTEESQSAAKDVLFGVGALEKTQKIVANTTKAEADNLSQYRVEREKRKAIDAEFVVVNEDEQK